MVASLQDLKFEMLPANIQSALSKFGISSTSDMRAMYDKYKDSPGMLNMGMQMLGLTPAAVDQIVAQASAKQQAAAPPTPAKPAAAVKTQPPQVKTAAPAPAPVRAAVSPAPQPKEAAPQRASQMPDATPPPSEPAATPDGEEDASEEGVDSAARAANERAAAEYAATPDEQPATTTTVEPPAAPTDEPVAGEDTVPTSVEPASADDGSGPSGADVGDAAAPTPPVADQDAAIEQLIANGRDASVPGDGNVGAGAMASRAMPRGATKASGRGSAPHQAVMDDIVSQMMAQNAAQQSMPSANPQMQTPNNIPPPPQAQKSQRPPPPVAQKSQRKEQLIADIFKRERGKSDAQAKRGAPTGKR